MARTFKVIGHRGAAGHAPENTFAAFDRGLELGVDGLETDIRASRDGELVLVHDATVDRTTDGTGAVADLSWAEQRRLNAAARWSPPVGTHSYGLQRIPRLHEFLHRYGGRTTFRLEIKALGVESRVVGLVRTYRLMDAVVFTSFQPAAIEAVRRDAPEAQTAYLSGAATFDEGAIRTALEAGANEIAPRAALMTPEGVAMAQAAGLRIWAWGVRDRETLARAVAAGIGGCTLDHPDWANDLDTAG